MHIRSFVVQAVSACFCLGVMMALPSAAHADDFTLFDVNLQLANGGTVTGTLDLDVTPLRAVFSDANLSYVMNGSVQASFIGPAYIGEVSGTSPYFTGDTFNSNDLQANGVGSYDLSINVPTASYYSFAGYTGGAVCSTSNDCENVFPFGSLLYGRTIAYVTAGDLTPASMAATPEPSGLILLGTGVLGIAGALRKRYVRA